MTLNYRQKAWLNLAGIVTAWCFTIYLMLLDSRNGGAIIIALLCSWVWGRYALRVLGYERRNTIRILKASLPKCGFSIRETEWNDEKTAVRFHGKYQGDNFMVEASPSSAYILVFDMPWTAIRASDPSVPRLLEAINETNIESANMSVCMMEPDEEGVRQIYTLSKTILPSYKPEQYLDSLMCDMLNRKKALHDNFDKPRPWMNTTKRGPVGFNVGNTKKDATDESIDVAAKSDTKVE